MLTIFCLVFSSIPASLRADEKAEFFENKIRPVLANQCYSCHGIKKQESELRVDHISFLIKEGFYGTPVVPGKIKESTIINAIKHTGDLQMPEGKPKLPASIIADFEMWITNGAYWPNEPVAKNENTFDLADRIERLPWIWKTPEMQPLPNTSIPYWSESDLDHFILAKLDEHGLKPAEFTDRTTWFRRLHITLLGIVPTAEQVNAFLEDEQPQARESAVDSILASPRFGERWARHWMDLMRYSETRGHESDFLIANAWHYRNYLIDAFNSNIAYDQFVREHIAGDLLPKPRLHSISQANQSVVATGWAFLGEEVHAPVNIRQDECDRTDNKIDVLSKSFLGLTVACARCHDHKFDAITQQDYYALSGFILSSNFRQIRFETIEHNRTIAREYELAKTAHKKQLATAISAALKNATNQFDENLKETIAVILDGKQPTNSQQQWIDELQSAAKDPFHPLHPLTIVISQTDEEETRKRLQELASNYQKQKAEADSALDGMEIIADYRNGNSSSFMQDGWTFGNAPVKTGDVIMGSSESPIAGFVEHGAAVKDSFWDVLKLHPKNEKDSGNLQAFARAGRMLRTPKTSLDSRKLYFLVSGAAEVYAGADSYLMVAGPIHKNVRSKFDTSRAWIEQNLTKTDAHRTHIEFGALPTKPLRVELVVQADAKPQLLNSPSDFLIDACQLNETDLTLAMIEHLVTTLSASIAQVTDNKGTEGSNPRDTARILNWVISKPELFPVSDDHNQALSELAGRFQRQSKEIQSRLQLESRTAISLMDGNGVNEFVLNRGNPQQPTHEAPRMLPEAFSHAQPIEGHGSGRLQLADQMVDPQNPLVARVIVNRVWHHMFGQGIVRSVDNFGYLGQRPSHPELLDHLAWAFMHQDQWDLKKLIRKIALSSTFRLSSKPNSQKAEVVDPENHLLHRASVKRMEAEVIRDSVLAVSGQLNLEMYGPPIPVQLTEFVVGRGAPSVNGPLDGHGRRSVYIAVRRNFLPTLMTTFDFPIPFTTRGNRNITNVPAQSLALMNDPLIYQQSQKWAEQILASRDLPTNLDRIRAMHLQLYGKAPSSSVIDNCSAVLEALAEYHETETSDIKVWHDFAHALFSANDFIYIH